MAKLGSEKRPVVARVHTDEKTRYVAETCAKKRCCGANASL